MPFFANMIITTTNQSAHMVSRQANITMAVACWMLVVWKLALPLPIDESNSAIQYQYLLLCAFLTYLYVCVYQQTMPWIEGILTLVGGG